MPTFRYVVKKGKPNYELYCRCLLLADKPGCTIDNVGKNFSSCEEELRDFVENSEYCPNLVKEDFKESQIESDESNQAIGQEEDPLIVGDALYVEPEGEPERAPKDDYMHLYDLGHELDDPESEEVQHEYDNQDPNYYDDLIRKKRI